VVGVVREEKHKILKDLIDRGIEADLVGASVWAGVETAKKLLQDFSGNIEYLRASDQCIFFSATDKFQIIVLPVFLTSGIKLIFSVAIRVQNKERGQESLRSKLFSRMGYNKDILGIDVEANGPQGQPVYIQRFPVTFKNNQSISRRVYFTNYFNWMGDVREIGLSPIMNELTSLAETGEWGLLLTLLVYRFWES